MATKRRPKPKSIAHGRPPTLVKPAAYLSSKATRTLIRSHHTLEKRKAKALAEGDSSTALKLAAEIEKQGGIETYQKASLLGQAKQRGGDSSKILMEWLQDVIPDLQARKMSSPLLLLEVGALSVSNACARSSCFDIQRIDLNSQADGILQQDFMERPLPTSEAERFDIISLSLVLNFVPDPAGRGDMLRRTLQFLRQTSSSDFDEVTDTFPCLFLVLPAPCVTNSRYLDEPKLVAIMESLGYVMIRQKLSNKLVYYLWRATNFSSRTKSANFKKIELRSGGTRNNFAIVMK